MPKKSLKQRIKETTLISTMEHKGFHLGPSGLWFYRLRDEFIDAVLIQSLAGGKGVRIHIFCVIPDILADYDMSKFPQDFDSEVGNLSRKYLTRKGIAFGGNDWPTATAAELEDSVSGIISLVQNELLPWFEEIDSRAALYESIHDDVKEDNGDYSDLLRAKLLSTTRG